MIAQARYISYSSSSELRHTKLHAIFKTRGAAAGKTGAVAGVETVFDFLADFSSIAPRHTDMQSTATWDSLRL